jgi:hypothetical protein
LNTVAEPSNKVAVFEYLSKFSTIHNNHQKYYRSGVSSIKILEEKVETYFEVFIFMPSNPFFDYFNQIIAELAAGGFLSYWRKLEINPKGLKRKIDEIGPQVLTMEHLMVGFQICLVSFAICVIIFVFEILFECFKTIFVSKIISIDKTVSLHESCSTNIEQFECQTIENTELAIPTDGNLTESQLSSSSTEAKLDTLKLFEIEILESTKSNRKEIEGADPIQDYLSVFGDLAIQYDTLITERS